MTQTTGSLSFTATDLTTFEDCEARFFHSQQHYRDGLLRSDRTAADIGSAVHDALMELHLQVETTYRKGRLPSRGATRERLNTLLDRTLRAKRIDAGSASAAERLRCLGPGLDAVTELILADMPAWAVDPSRGEPLVWVEPRLDHGPSIPAVELDEDYLIRTRPDVIGIRADGSSQFRVVVRDYKSRGQTVDPTFDAGILVRALWALAELSNRRCRWFLAGRDIDSDHDHVDLETVNLMHGDTREFLLKASLTRAQLLSLRDRLTEQMLGMAVTLAAGDADDVPASPGPFCLEWCTYLGKCEPGMDHIRKYCGDEELDRRMQLVSSS